MDVGHHLKEKEESMTTPIKINENRQPGTFPGAGQRLTHAVAERIARNWSTVLINGLLLAAAGILIFSINWTLGSLSTFLGSLFIFQGLMLGLTPGLGSRTRTTNVVIGLLSIALGIFVIALPTPGLVALGILLGSWLIVIGTITILGAFAVRRILQDWWLFLLDGLVAIPLGVLALAEPGATLAALVTVGGIWAVVVGVVRVVTAFQLRRLPDEVDANWAGAPADNGTPHRTATVAPAGA
jgi:uncharacterized membrane protein HdeD (DUF308 family)